MARYEARLARLERAASGQPPNRATYVTFALTESLAAAIGAAESEMGLKIREVHPFALSKKAGMNLANALLTSFERILR